MKTIKQRYTIRASKDKVWEALTNPEIIEKWGAGPCKMSEDENFEFSLWGGEIFGKNIKVVKNKILSQKWYGGKWEKPSILTFTLTEKDEKTTVDLLQVDVPDEEYKDIKEGWKNYYMIPLKNLIES